VPARGIGLLFLPLALLFQIGKDTGKITSMLDFSPALVRIDFRFAPLFRRDGRREE
jgi:hypothetical protein